MPKRVVIQWSRLGDLLQTRVLLRHLCELFPQDDIILSGDARYASIAKRFPEVTRFAAVDLSQLTALSRHPQSHAQVLQRLRDEDQSFFDSVADVFVLSCSMAAVLYAELLRPAQISGYRREQDRLADVPLLRKGAAVSRSEHDCGILLADRWALLAGSPLSGRPLERLPVMDAAGHVPITDGRIGIICDAGEDYRTIPPQWGVQLAEILLNRGRCLALFSAKLPVANDPYTELHTRFGSLVQDRRGKTTLKTLARELKALAMIIGPDTGALHLAAALNTPVLGLYFGGAHAAATGPYTDDVLVVQCPEWSEASCWAIAELAVGRLAGDRVPAETSLNLLEPHFDEFGLAYLSRQAGAAELAKLQQRRRTYIPAAVGLQIGKGEVFRKPFGDFNHAVNPQEMSAEPPSGIAIIIPECGQTHYTDELLEDLARECAAIEHEIIVISSGEAAGRVLAIRKPAVSQERCDRTLSFAAACNNGARAARMPRLLFLNNDVRIPPRQLEQFARHHAPAICSPIICYPDGLIQNAGVDFIDSEIVERDHGQQKLSGYDQPPAALSAVALLVDRSAFYALNGFDEAYVNGYEDLDLCLRAGEKGLTCGIDTNSHVLHFRGSSAGRHAEESKNRALFDSRWRKVFKPAHSGVDQPRRNAPAQIVIISDESPQAAGSRLRWLWPLRRLKLGRAVTFIGLQSQNEIPMEAIERALENAELAIAFRPLSAASSQDCLLRAIARCGVPLLVDVDDLVLERFAAASVRAAGRKDYEERFRKLLERADVVSAASPALQESMRRQGIAAELLPLIPDERLLRPRVPSPESATLRIGFFGSPAHLLDLGSILPAIEATLSAREHVMFYWWGCRPGELAYHPQVRQGGPIVADYESHIARLQKSHLDVAVIPLLNTEHGRARSPVKYYEYGGAGIPGVYSATAPYASCVQNGVTGLLAQDSTTAWTNTMLQLVDNADLRTTLARNAHRDIEQRIDGGNELKVLAALLKQMAPGLTRPHDVKLEPAEIC